MSAWPEGSPLGATVLPSSSEGKLEDLILDSGAFIMGGDGLMRFATMADRFWTTSAVLAEIRDARTRAWLEASPVPIRTREPKKESMSAVESFATKTGDIAALSRTDLGIVALLYEIDREARKRAGENVEAQDRENEQRAEDAGAAKKAASEKKPAPKPVASDAPKPTSWAAALKQALPEQDEEAEEPRPAEPEEEEEEEHSGSEEEEEDEEDDEEDEEEEDPAVAWPTLPPRVEAPRPVSAWTRPPVLPKAPEPAKPVAPVTIAAAPPAGLEPTQVRSSRIIGLGLGGVTTNEIDQDEDDGGGWAKPTSGDAPSAGANFGKNPLEGWDDMNPLSEKQKKAAPQPARKIVKVACGTTDYAMQNVILQMRLNLISLEGRRVTSLRHWVLKCDACLRILPPTESMTRKFCPSCGNATLARLAYSIDARGVKRYHYSKNRRIPTRGHSYGIAKDANLLLREDQVLYGQWAQRARRKQDTTSMFGVDVNDSMLKSTSTKTTVPLRIGMGSTNPNAQKGRERRGAKKKKRPGFD